MGPEHASSILSAVVSSAARLDVLLAAGNAELKGNAALLDEFHTIIQELKSRLKVRNEYAHGIYAVNSKKQLCILHKYFEIPPQPGQMRVIYPHALAEEGVRAIETNEKLHAFVRQIWNQTPMAKRLAWHIRCAPQESLHPPNKE